jgi:hypothetical protein
MNYNETFLRPFWKTGQIRLIKQENFLKGQAWKCMFFNFELELMFTLLEHFSR